MITELTLLPGPLCVYYNVKVWSPGMTAMADRKAEGHRRFQVADTGAQCPGDDQKVHARFRES
jgi:hypothetical protein